MEQVYNFNAGPAALPKDVLTEAHENWFDFRGTKANIMELSHRSKAYDELHKAALERIRSLMNLDDSYDVLFLQGGASLQFAMVPMNFLSKDKVGGYILTGSWSKKALREAKQVGHGEQFGPSDSEFRKIPSATEFHQPDPKVYDYIHLTTNNTIYGTQWQELPTFSDVPVLIDSSSDFLSYDMPKDSFDLLYAGAQKNAGPSGVTIVVIKKELIEKGAKEIPHFLQYRTHAEKNSLYHTPPTFSVYMLSLTLKWIEQQGGLQAMQERNTYKSNLIYNVIDQSNNFYKGWASIESRSKMNVTFTLPSEELTRAFIKESEKEGMMGLKGHRSVGGLRASLYNAVPLEAVQYLEDFMKRFYMANRNK
ncbi:3-phosphoserine/phosphohydroxythreonine transaminase [Bacillaceae bacterium S4-13-56]